MQDRIINAKSKASVSALERSKNLKDIAKLKRNKKVLSPERVAQSFIGLQQGGWKQPSHEKELQGNQQKLMGDITMQDQEVAASGSLLVPSNTCCEEMNLDVNLTGPQGEARQEK
jgi:hypothetical protein